MTNPIITALHPKIADALPLVISEAKARGYLVGVESSVRSAEEQDRLYALGRTAKNPDGFDPEKKPLGNIVTNALPWTSWHCYGLAVDLVPKNSKGDFYWWGDNDFKWVELANVCKLFGFEWGGGWSTFTGDLDHFQMRGSIPNVHIAKDILFTQGLDALWAMVK